MAVLRNRTPLSREAVYLARAFVVVTATILGWVATVSAECYKNGKLGWEMQVRESQSKVACPRISVHLVKRIPLVSHTPSDSHIPGCQYRCKTPHLCRIKIPQFVEGGRSLRLAECHTTEDAVRLVSTDGGYRSDYLGETVYVTRTACTRRIHQRHCPPNGTGPEDGPASFSRRDRTSGEGRNGVRLVSRSLRSAFSKEG